MTAPACTLSSVRIAEFRRGSPLSNGDASDIPHSNEERKRSMQDIPNTADCELG